MTEVLGFIAAVVAVIAVILSQPFVRWLIVYGCVLWIAHMLIKDAVVAALKKAKREGYLRDEHLRVVYRSDGWYVVDNEGLRFPCDSRENAESVRQDFLNDREHAEALRRDLVKARKRAR